MASMSMYQHIDGKVFFNLKRQAGAYHGGKPYTVLNITVRGYGRDELDLFFNGPAIEELTRLQDAIEEYKREIAEAGVDVYA